MTIFSDDRCLKYITYVAHQQKLSSIFAQAKNKERWWPQKRGELRKTPSEEFTVLVENVAAMDYGISVTKIMVTSDSRQVCTCHTVNKDFILRSHLFSFDKKMKQSVYFQKAITKMENQK